MLPTLWPGDLLTIESVAVEQAKPGDLALFMINAIQFLKSQGLNIILANLLMTANRHDHAGVRALARELG
jgi:hypothetical protein